MAEFMITFRATDSLAPVFTGKKWCAREDLNLQALRHQILSLACLPFHHARDTNIFTPIFSGRLTFAALCDRVNVLKPSPTHKYQNVLDNRKPPICRFDSVRGPSAAIDHRPQPSPKFDPDLRVCV
jgi:hypothetical protein